MTGATATNRLFLWSCSVVAAVLLQPCVTASENATKEDSRSFRCDVELLDSVRCWCSPLWGYNAPKIVEGKNGEIFVALFSGDYPEANVQILKRTADGTWKRGKTFAGAYQPSLLFVDGGGRLNVVQNSQTQPLIHFRSTDDDNLNSFAKVAEGNGQEDGRGWYVGAGIHNDTIYMAYILLSYDLFLTWKHVSDSSWKPAVLIHKGSVDTERGNHSWTRPRFQFAGRTGFFVVNETSDGSVKNTYNAVQLVSFDLSDPRKFTTECIDRVPQGFGSFSPDFAASADGWLYCIVERNGRIYGPDSVKASESGVFIFSRETRGGSWKAQRVFETVSDAALIVHDNSAVTALRITRKGTKTLEDRIEQKDPAAGVARCEAVRSEDHGSTWTESRVGGNEVEARSPSHIQVITGANSWGGKGWRGGVFEDVRGKVQGSKLSYYGVYFFQVSEGK